MERRRGRQEGSVSPSRFEQMLAFPDDCFLGKEWWGELWRQRDREAAREASPGDRP